MAPTQALTPTVLPTFTPLPWGQIPQARSGGVPIPTPFPLLAGQDLDGPDPVVNVLLIGSDQRGSGAFRTDTLIIASIRTRSRVVSLISIPRDLYVYVPGRLMQRINTAYLYGQLDRYPGRGPGLLRDTILYNLGIRIDYLAMVDFSGFRRIVDRLGGIDLPMACPYTDWRLIDPSVSDQLPSNWHLYPIGPGVVHMNGELALWYARSRLRSTDFDRGRRQQEVLRAIFDKALQFDIVPMLPQLYEEFGATVTTDMSLSDLMGFAPLALNLKDASIRSYYIHSRLVKSWRTPEGASVQLPKGEKIKNMLLEALSPPDGAEIIHLQTVVEVVNASGQPDMERLAAERLHYAGFATRFGERLPRQPKTRVFDLTAAQDPNRSASLLTIFGLPQSRLQPAVEPETEVAYRLVIGSDFDPCFNPIQLVH